MNYLTAVEYFFKFIFLCQLKIVDLCFFLLQDLIQKYEGNLFQLSKRCDEMKKLYSDTLVHTKLKHN